MSANINKSSKKLTLIISMIALMVVSVVIVLIILFSCKNQKSISIESSDGTSATEITIPLNQEQSKTYVGKYNNEVLSDCE
jgi:competence protein ComGC